MTHEFAKNKLVKGGAVDIEVMLWQLGELKSFLHCAVDTNHIAGWFLQGNRITHGTGKEKDLAQMRQTASDALPRLDALISEINKSVYGLYQRIPTNEEIEGTWLPALEFLASRECKVELVTTNYDVILETVLDRLAETTTLRGDVGWRGSVYRALEVNLWEKQPFLGG